MSVKVDDWDSVGNSRSKVEESFARPNVAMEVVLFLVL